MVSTLAIQLVAGQVRGRANCGTVHALPTIRVPRPDDLRDAFLVAYDRFAAPCREIDEPGVALIAVDEHTGTPCGVVRLRARIGRQVVAIVGRHDKCDLFLDAKAALSLRQLVVVVEPVHDFAATVRYRLFDLRTECGFTDETGRPMRGLTAEGPAFVRFAGYILFALPLGDSTDWPERATDAWASLPERVYLDEQPCEESRSMMRRSLLLRTGGPRHTGMVLVDSGVAGTLEWIGIRHRALIPVGDAALTDGLLLGRYTRCDSAQLVDDPLLSRVHALLVQTRAGLLAIDTASSYGIRLAGGPAQRVVELPDRAELELGRSTRVRWRRYR